MPFPPYWLDASVYITAKQSTYRFRTFPVFWSFLSAQISNGGVRSPRLVYQELVDNVDNQDELATWVKNRRKNGLCVNPSQEVQSAFTAVADYVRNNDRYGQPEQARFLSGADPWLVAHAIAEGGTVVTLETRVSPDSRKVRIPDVCAHFSVRCVNTSDMLEELGFSANSVE